MKKVFNIDIYFEIEVNEEDVYEKGWKYIHKHLPQCFEVEGNELSIVDDLEEVT